MIASLIPFGFLLVIAYLLVDSVLGQRHALWSALAVGSAGFGYSLATEAHGFDYLGLAQFLSFASLVAASLRTRDPFYFRIHGPAASMLAAGTLLAYWHIADRALLLDLVSSQVGLAKLVALDPRLTQDTVSDLLRVLSFQLPWWLLLHALYTIYAAANYGKWGWAFARVPGFLLMLFLAMGFAQSAAYPLPK